MAVQLFFRRMMIFNNFHVAKTCLFASLGSLEKMAIENCSLYYIAPKNFKSA